MEGNPHENVMKALSVTVFFADLVAGEISLRGLHCCSRLVAIAAQLTLDPEIEAARFGSRPRSDPVVMYPFFPLWLHSIFSRGTEQYRRIRSSFNSDFPQFVMTAEAQTLGAARQRVTRTDRSRREWVRGECGINWDPAGDRTGQTNRDRPAHGHRGHEADAG